MFLNRFTAAILLLLVLACGGEAKTRTVPVWVLSNGFHSAVAFRTQDVGPTVRGAVANTNAPWVLVGWGDKEFFMAKKVTPWITIKAVCWPTPSALHVVPLQGVPQQVYRNSEIIRLELEPASAAELVKYVEAAFARRSNGEPIYLGPGFSRSSVFFLGIERFYFPKMCNWWVAAGFRRAGFPLHPATAITAHELMRQLRKEGKRVSGLRLPVDGF